MTKTGATESSSSVDYATSDDSAADGTDYTGTSGTLAFAAGAVGGTLGFPSSGTGTIDENDCISLAS